MYMALNTRRKSDTLRTAPTILQDPDYNHGHNTIQDVYRLQYCRVHVPGLRQAALSPVAQNDIRKSMGDETCLRKASLMPV